jgi:hypothetical protein
VRLHRFPKMNGLSDHLRAQAVEKRRMADMARRVAPSLSQPRDRALFLQQAQELEAEAPSWRRERISSTLPIPRLSGGPEKSRPQIWRHRDLVAEGSFFGMALATAASGNACRPMGSRARLPVRGCFL